MKKETNEPNRNEKLKYQAYEEDSGDEMASRLPYYIIAFIILFMYMIDFAPWDLFKMNGEQLYDTFIRSILLMIGILAIDLGHESATKFRKRSKTTGSLIGFIIGVLAILYALGFISFPFLGG